MTINQRVGEIIKMLGLRKGAFANAISINPASLSRILSGRSSVTQDLISKIVKKYGVNRHWLENNNSEFPMFDNLNINIVSEPKANYNKTNNQTNMNEHLMLLSSAVRQLAQRVEDLEEEVKLLSNNEKKRSVG